VDGDAIGGIAHLQPQIDTRLRGAAAADPAAGNRIELPRKCAKGTQKLRLLNPKGIAAISPRLRKTMFGTELMMSFFQGDPFTIFAMKRPYCPQRVSRLENGYGQGGFRQERLDFCVTINEQAVA
jgi:hypothetical protein